MTLSFPLIEVVCAAIVALYLVGRLRSAPRDERKELAATLATVSAAAWLAEDTAIRLFAFYSYAPGWWPFLDRVPLLVVLIWPVVIDSAGQMARAALATPSPRRAALLAGSIVFADAWLIEPVAVQAGMWQWHAPGLHGVPPVGVLGWALFTAFSSAWLERPGPLLRRLAWLPLAVTAATHVALVMAWWGALRWLSRPLPAPAAAALLWMGSLGFTAWLWRTGARRRMPLVVLLRRIPAATFFLVLLVVAGRTNLPLVAWVLAFVPPYLALLGFW